MAGWLASRHWRRLAFIGVTLYAVFLITAPLEHHDLACHVKTPLHCTSCASSHLGADPHTPALPGASALTDAGCATPVERQVVGFLLDESSTGRSPPRLG